MKKICVILSLIFMFFSYAESPIFKGLEQFFSAVQTAFPKIDKENCLNIKVVGNAHGNEVVFWTEVGSGKPVLRCHFREKGTGFSKIETVAELSNKGKYDVAVDVDGNICVVWEKGHHLYSAYKPSKANSFINIKDFEAKKHSRFKLKSSESRKFFLIYKAENNLYLSTRESGKDALFSEPESILKESTEGSLTSFDFDVDAADNIVLALCVQKEVSASLVSDVFYSFKSKNESFQPLQKLRTQSKILASNVNVNSHGRDCRQRIWTIFWQEQSTVDLELCKTFIRGSYLIHQEDKPCPTVLSKPKVLFRKQESNLKEFSVLSRSQEEVVCFWTEDKKAINYAVFNIKGLLDHNKAYPSKFITGSVSSVGHQPHNIYLTNLKGHIFLCWNFDMKQSYDTRCGYIHKDAYFFSSLGSFFFPKLPWNSQNFLK